MFVYWEGAGDPAAAVCRSEVSEWDRLEVQWGKSPHSDLLLVTLYKLN
jgi:hypothetical protein